MAIALCGLILLEQIYRNAGAQARRALRYLALGIGGIFVYDLFLFSQAELLREISQDAWDARGLVNALLVPAIAVAVRRNPDWSLDIFVSRHVLFYTGTIVAVGIYLLTMAVGGYYVRVFGGHWGGVAQILFFMGAAAVLLSLIFSGSLRTRFKVFLNKHFYSNKYDYRVEWLRFIQTLESTEEGSVGRTALRAVAQIFESPGGLLFIADDSERCFVAVAAIDEGEGRALLEDLLAWATQPRFVYRHEWSVGDMLIWDNTGVLHRVEPYSLDSGRMMHRTTVAGTEATV
jgi:putative PEP-CTERM system histidine kinase